MIGLRRGSIAIVVIVAFAGCSSLKNWVRSPLKKSSIRVEELSTVSLTAGPSSQVNRVLVSEAWQWRGRNALGSAPQSFVAPKFLGADDVLIATLGGGIGVYKIPSLKPKWYVPVPVGVGAESYVDESFVYSAGMDARVRKLRLDSGREEWSATLSAESTGGVTVNQGTVFVSADDQTLWALDDKTGKVRWTYKRPSPGSNVYWSLRGSQTPVLSPDGRRIYVGFSDGTFVCLESSSGQTVWERNFDRAGRFKDADQNIVMSRNGERIYVPLVDGDLVVLKTIDGGTAWTVPRGGGATPLVDEVSGTLVAVLITGELEKLRLSDGQPLWTVDLKAGPLSEPTQILGVGIAVTSSERGLHIVDPASGLVLYERRLGPGTLASPRFDGRRLLVLSPRNQMHQFKVEPSGS
jgi:outer membrane protein assembly factor BamB